MVTSAPRIKKPRKGHVAAHHLRHVTFSPGEERAKAWICPYPNVRGANCAAAKLPYHATVVKVWELNSTFHGYALLITISSGQTFLVGQGDSQYQVLAPTTPCATR